MGHDQLASYWYVATQCEDGGCITVVLLAMGKYSMVLSMGEISGLMNRNLQYAQRMFELSSRGLISTEEIYTQYKVLTRLIRSLSGRPRLLLGPPGSSDYKSQTSNQLHIY